MYKSCGPLTFRSGRGLRAAGATWAALLLLVQLSLMGPAVGALPKRGSRRTDSGNVPVKVAVVAKEGTRENAVQKTIIRALRTRSGVRLASSQELAIVRAAYRRRALQEEDFVSLSKEFGIAAFAMVQISGRKSFTLTVAIRNGANGALLAEAEWSNLSMSRLKSVQQTFWQTLGPHIRKARPRGAATSGEAAPPVPVPPPETLQPPPPSSSASSSPISQEPKSEPAASATATSSVEPTQVTETPKPREAVDPQRLTLDAELGGGAFTRDFSYSSDASGLGSYHLSFGPMISGTVQWYPLARLTGGFLSWIGLVGSGDYAVALKSTAPDGASLRTTSYRYSGGIRFRWPIGASELGLSASYGSATFTIKGQNPPPGSAALPDVSYRFLRPEISGRVSVLRVLWILASVSYLHGLDSGQISSSAFFPHATTKGFTGALGVAWEMTSSFELRLIGEYDRYSLTMNSRPGDPLTAQGAVDQYFLGRLTAAYRWK